MSTPREPVLPAELSEFRSVLALHQPHAVQAGTRTCAYCGGVWEAVQLGDGPGFISGCVERLDAQVALAEVDQLPVSLIGPTLPGHVPPEFLSPYR